MKKLLMLVLLAGNLEGQGRAIVYTTAESTSLRLTATDTLVFKPSEPTSEGKVYVFVDPRKTFQSFLGIGGALTHAAAETRSEEHTSEIQSLAYFLCRLLLLKKKKRLYVVKATRKKCLYRTRS